MNSLKNPIKNGNCIFIDGPAGSGKTYLYNILMDEVKMKYPQQQIIATATTGIASTLIPNGKTMHSTFKIPIPIFPNS